MSNRAFSSEGPEILCPGSPTKMLDDGTWLISNGYEPIVADGKRPVAGEWQKRPNTLEAVAAEMGAFPNATNIGLRTGRTVGLDIDIKNPNHADAVKMLAFEMLGQTPLVRVGSKGAMLVYCNATPIKKITVAGQGAKVEILGVGQQFIAYGIHPDTGKPYEWVNSDDVGVYDPLNVPFDALPVVTPDQLRAFADCAKMLMEEFGYGPVKVMGDFGGKNADAPREAARPGFAPDQPSDIARAVAFLKYTPAAVEFDGSDDATIKLANAVGDLGVTQESALEIMWEHWVNRCEGNWTQGWLEEKIRSAYHSRQNEIGRYAVGDPKEAFAEFFANMPKEDATGSETNCQGKNINPDLVKFYRGREPDEDEELPEPEFWDPEKTIPKISKETDGGTVVVYYGPFGAMKTTLLLADTLDAIQKGALVIFAAGEGSHGLRKSRLPACCRERGMTTKDLRGKFRTCPAVPNFTIEIEVNSFVEAFRVFNPNIIIIDTLSTASGDIEENSDKIGKLFTANGPFGRMARELRCTVIVVHHTGKDEGRGARGHSSIGGNVDGLFLITADKDARTITKKVVKMRDGEEGFGVEYTVTPPAQVPVAKKVGRVTQIPLSDALDLLGRVTATMERRGIRGDAKAVTGYRLSRLMLALDDPQWAEEGATLTPEQERRQKTTERALDRAKSSEKFKHLVRKIGSNRRAPYLWSLPYHDGAAE